MSFTFAVAVTREYSLFTSCPLFSGLNIDGTTVCSLMEELCTSDITSLGHECSSVFQPPHNFYLVALTLGLLALLVTIGTSLLIYFVAAIAIQAGCVWPPLFCYYDSIVVRQRGVDKCKEGGKWHDRWWKFFSMSSCHRLYIGSCFVCLHRQTPSAVQDIIKSESTVLLWNFLRFPYLRFAHVLDFWRESRLKIIAFRDIRPGNEFCRHAQVCCAGYRCLQAYAAICMGLDAAYTAM